MSILTTGRHRRMSVGDLKKRINNLEKQVGELTGERDDLVCALGRSVIRIASLEETARAQAGKVVRRDAEVQRLTASLKNTQQALADARPRITQVPAIDRPYVAAVPIPYPVPVGRSTANDETQELAVLDQPTVELPAAS